MPLQISGRDILRLALPDFFIQLLIVSVSIIEMFLVGKVGLTEVAAVSIANIVLTFINDLVGECDTSSRTLAANFSGSEDWEKVTKTFLIGIFVPMAVGLGVVAFGNVISYSAFYLVENAEIRNIGFAYLNIALIYVPFALVFFSLTGFINGMGDTVCPFFIRIIMHTLNIFLDVGFLFGLFGLPNLGIKGVAIALIFTYFVGCVLSVFVVFKKKFIMQRIGWVDIKNAFLGRCDVLKEFLSISKNVGLQFGLCDLSMYIVALIVERFGVRALAINQIVYYQIYSALQLPIYSFYIACSIIVGKLVGHNDFSQINSVTIKICKMAMCIVLCSVLITFATSSVLGNFFSPLDKDVAIASASAIKLLVVLLVFDALYIILSGGLMGAGDSRFIMLQSTISEYFVMLPLSYLLSVMFGMGLLGIYFAFSLKTIFNLLIIGLRFFVVREWNNIDIVKQKSSIYPAFVAHERVHGKIQNLFERFLFLKRNF